MDLFARKDRGFGAPTVPEHHADLGPKGPCVPARPLSKRKRRDLAIVPSGLGRQGRIYLVASGPPESTISTRRLRAREPVVSLSVIGIEEPNPATSMFDAATPCPMRQFISAILETSSLFGAASDQIRPSNSSTTRMIKSVPTMPLGA
jgi:hypothetical protein